MAKKVQNSTVILTPEQHYRFAQKVVAAMDVVIGKDEQAKVYLEAAKEMEAAGVYDDAAEQAAAYRALAAQLQEQGRAEQFQKAKARLENSTDDLEKKLAVQTLEALGTHPEAERLIQQYKAEQKKRAGKKQKIVLSVLLLVALAVGLLLWSLQKSEQTRVGASALAASMRSSAVTASLDIEMLPS